MKGVIVQVGHPKSIVLFNNGKIGAIPTPEQCHVGMVVSVKFNSLLKIILISLAAVLLIALGIGIGAHFWGSSPKIPMPPPSHEHVPDEYLPDEHIPIEQLPDEYIPDEHLLDEHLPDEQMPGWQRPGEHIPGWQRQMHGQGQGHRHRRRIMEENR